MILYRQWLGSNLFLRQHIDWRAVLFLLSGMGLPLFPVLLFQSHPSETYLYLSIAFYALLVSYGLVLIMPLLIPERRGIRITMIVLAAGLSCAATWVRNDRVVRCADTARRILYGLPAELRNGPWTVSFANVPADTVTRRYGFYGFRGIDTIGHGSSANSAVTSAFSRFIKTSC